MKKLTIITFIAIILFTRPPFVNAAQIYDLADQNNWNIRIDGAESTNYLGLQTIASGDLNNNGRDDLVIISPGTDYNSRSNSGSLYIIFDAIYSNLAGKGNTIDLANTSNWNIRFDASSANEFGNTAANNFTNGTAIIDDIDGDGKNDLIFGSPLADNNGRANSGSVYIFYNNLLNSYIGTGNALDLNESSSYNVRFDGPSASSDFGLSIPYTASRLYNLIGDIGIDLLLSAEGITPPTGRSTSGSTYLIGHSLFGNLSQTGNIVDLANTSNFSIRFDGASAGDGSGITISAGQITDTNSYDILIGAGFSDGSSHYNGGALYIIPHTIYGLIQGTGNTIDLASDSSFFLRIDGEAAYTTSTRERAVSVGDLDNDSRDDIILGSWYLGNGTAWILYNTLINSYSSTGNTLDLADTSKYNIKINGAQNADRFTLYGIVLSDYFNVGKLDVIIGAGMSDNNSRSDSGSSYLLRNNTVVSYTGTGNIINFSNPAKYDLRYDSSDTNNRFVFARNKFSDLNNDGKSDMVIASTRADNNSRSDSGSVYLIFNFPHSIMQTSNSRSGDTANVFGSITATDSTTAISGIQYQINSNNPTSEWSSAGCSANDGIFDATSEAFTCTISGIPTTDGTHTIYFRAYDTNSSYTAQINYLTYSYTISSPTLTPGSNDDTPAPQIPQSAIENASGVFTPIDGSSTTSGKNGVQRILVIIEPQTLHHDGFFSSSVQEIPSIPSTIVGGTVTSNILPNPITGESYDSAYITQHKLRSNTITAGSTETGQILGIKTENILAWQIGNIHNIWYKAYSPGYEINNAAKIIPELQSKPSIIALSYTDADLVPPGQPTRPFNPTSLRLAHSLDGVTWTMLPTSVVDTQNKTVAALDKVGGYYMIVAVPSGRRRTTTTSQVRGVTINTKQQMPPTQPRIVPQKVQGETTIPQHTPPSLIQRIGGFIQNIFK